MAKTIRLDDELHARIAALVESKTDTYNDIIMRLVDFYENNSRKKR